MEENNRFDEADYQVGTRGIWNAATARYNTNLLISADGQRSTDPKAARKLRAFFGKNLSEQAKLASASEDFSNLAKPHGMPYAFWSFGGTGAE